MIKTARVAHLFSPLLTPLARLTRRNEFRWVNRRISETYTQALVPMIERKLRFSTGLIELKVIARHTDIQVKRFNFLESDLDITLLLPKWSKSSISLAQNHYERLKKILPFLGEAELYEPSEWELKKLVHTDFNDLAQTIWKLRKWGWQKKAFDTAKTSYHCQKAERSIQWIRHDLGLDPGELYPSDEDRKKIVALLLSFLPEVEISISKSESPSLSKSHLSKRSSFLEWELGVLDAPFQGTFYLEFETQDLVRFLGILPGGSYLFYPLTQSVLDVRKENEIGSKLAALSLSEYLLLQSVKRSADATQVNPEWERELTANLSQYLPKKYAELLPTQIGPTL